LGDESKVNEMGGTRGKGNTNSVFVGKPEGRRPPGKTYAQMWDNVKADLKETAWENMDWVHKAHKRDNFLTS
jgi:hypothetical protein